MALKLIMRLHPSKRFLGFSAYLWSVIFISLSAGLPSAGANSPAAGATGEVRHENISVQAPFAMPAIEIPVFPKREFMITHFGAVEGTNISGAIRKAIAACHDAGGGRVVIPRGKWFTSKIHFQNNVNLHLAEGAVLLFSDNPEDYLPAVQSSYEGNECFNYSPLVYAFGCTNVAITGTGTLEAKLDIWKIWFPRSPSELEAMKQLYT
ncbi:MAG: hypothetical protein WCJ07_02605, partial [Verrucomicrobiota bacterium]